MPFYTQSKEEEAVISGQAVDVIASFNPSGDIKPLYIGVTDLYGNYLKTKIEYVRFKKDIYGGISFSCMYQYCDSLKEVELRYFFKSHLWVIA